jgi:putative PIN family toxin of toxin-antitoxin system
MRRCAWPWARHTPCVGEDVPRIVLDVNVLVSAFITPRGASARILLELRSGAFELLVTPRLLAELAEVLQREKIRRYVTADEAAAYVELMRLSAITIDDPEPSASAVVADPDDEYLIDLAREGRAHAIVSVDQHLLELADRLPVMSPSAFLASLID